MSDETQQSQTKGGRPKKPPEERRTLSHTVHYSPKEEEVIERKREAAGMGLSPYFREAAMNASIESEGRRKLRKRMEWIGSKLNELLRLAESGEVPEEERLKAVLEETRELISELR